MNRFLEKYSGKTGEEKQAVKCGANDKRIHANFADLLPG